MQLSYNPLNQPVNQPKTGGGTQIRGANGQRLVEQSPRSGRLSFYIWRRGAGQRILAGGEGRRSCGPQPPEPALPSTAPRQARIRAGPRRITLAAPSRAAVAAHFSLCFYPGVRAAKPAALTRGYNSWHRPAVPAPQSSAKCRNSRAREAGDRKGREIPVARFADLFRLLRTFPIPQGGTVGFLLSPASRASGVRFMNVHE